MRLYLAPFKAHALKPPMLVATTLLHLCAIRPIFLKEPRYAAVIALSTLCSVLWHLNPEHAGLMYADYGVACLWFCYETYLVAHTDYSIVHLGATTLLLLGNKYADSCIDYSTCHSVWHIFSAAVHYYISKKCEQLTTLATNNRMINEIEYTEKRNKGVVSLECELQRKASTYGFAPKIVDVVHGETHCTISTNLPKAKTLAEIYGTDERKIPAAVWTKIHFIVDQLFYDERIEYTAILPQNFAELNGKIYVINFEGARYRYGETHWFLAAFLEGRYGWNSGTR